MPDASASVEAPHARPTLFCLHALGASAREFDPLTMALGDRFDVVAIDLPGFGDAADLGAQTVEQMADHVIRIVAETGSPRWMLVGHSMGGKIAAVVAARALSGEAPVFGLGAVALLAGSPPSPEPLDEETRERMIGWAEDGHLDESEAREFIEANVRTELDPESDALVIDDLERTNPDAWIAWLRRGKDEDWSRAVGVLDVPAVLIAGGADGPLGTEGQRDLNGPVYPRARVVTLEGAGHFLPLERTEEVALHLVELWERADAPTVPVDVGRVIAGEHTSARTRGIMARRYPADDPDREPAVLTTRQLGTLRAVADRVVPQGDGPGIDLAARVDAQLAAGVGDGWRFDDLPPDAEAYRAALDALEVAGPGGAGFTALDPDGRDAVLAALAAGDGLGDAAASGPDAPVPGGAAAASALGPVQLEHWFEDARNDLVRQWLAHPATMARIGFDGFANGGDGARKQGFELLAADRHEPWEPAMLPLRVSASRASSGADPETDDRAAEVA